ncbi:MAG: ATP-binding protein [Blautia sp.]|nr:ATP-binding protein [Blautia sp.]
MTLRNDQYDLIMREYSRRQNAGHSILEERRAETYALIPRLSGIDREISGLFKDQIRQKLLSDIPPDTAALQAKTRALEEERTALLVSNGFPADYLEVPCVCPLCHDTGYMEDGRKCRCFRRLEIDLLYRQDELNEILSKENFDTFSFEWYSDTIKDEATGRTSLDLAKSAYNASREFAEHFDDDFSSLFFFGDTGVGKTFLSHCIAAELLGTMHSVLYFSAYELFDRLAAGTFSDAQDSISDNIIADCDLLIIDDLGTELTNAFVSSQLFLCVDQRLKRRKPTVISTNLSLKNFSDTYSERTFSRIASAYRMCKLTGKDIRIQKKFNGGN